MFTERSPKWYKEVPYVISNVNSSYIRYFSKLTLTLMQCYQLTTNLYFTNVFSNTLFLTQDSMQNTMIHLINFLSLQSVLVFQSFLVLLFMYLFYLVTLKHTGMAECLLVWVCLLCLIIRLEALGKDTTETSGYLSIYHLSIYLSISIYLFILVDFVIH